MGAVSPGAVWGGEAFPGTHRAEALSSRTCRGSRLAPSSWRKRYVRFFEIFIVRSITSHPPEDCSFQRGGLGVRGRRAALLAPPELCTRVPGGSPLLPALQSGLPCGREPAPSHPAHASPAHAPSMVLPALGRQHEVKPASYPPQARRTPLGQAYGDSNGNALI